MRVLGIDPGSRSTGWGLLTGSTARPALVECGTIRLDARVGLPARLAVLQAELESLIVRLQPSCAAVESPFHGASARSALQLAHARGVVLAVLARSGLPVEEYTPASVKKTVTGSGRADKHQVAVIVDQLLGPSAVPRGHDASDALAIALCHLSTAGFGSAVARAGRSDGR